MSKHFPDDPPKTKEEMEIRLQSLPLFFDTMHPAVVKIYKEFGLTMFLRSIIPCSGGEKVIEKYMKIVKPKRVLEIGTNRGMSTAFLAMHCQEVYTIDLIESSSRQKIWDCLGLKNIVSYTVKNNEEKAKLIEKLDFDFAFPDGDHFHDYKSDFELVKRCGNVLQHEYWSNSPVKDFYDEMSENKIGFQHRPLDISKNTNFVFWTKHKYPELFGGVLKVEADINTEKEKEISSEPIKETEAKETKKRKRGRILGGSEGNTAVNMPISGDNA